MHLTAELSGTSGKSLQHNSYWSCAAVSNAMERFNDPSVRPCNEQWLLLKWSLSLGQYSYRCVTQGENIFMRN